MNISSDQRMMLIRALDTYVEHLEGDSLSEDQDLAEWSEVELNEVVEMRRQLKLESK